MQLSKRLCDVMDGVCEGLTNRQIAERLGLAENSIQAYMTRIFDIYGVRDRESAKSVYEGEKQ